jgi:hypothetical protein
LKEHFKDIPPQMIIHSHPGRSETQMNMVTIT